MTHPLQSMDKIFVQHRCIYYTSELVDDQLYHFTNPLITEPHWTLSGGNKRVYCRLQSHAGAECIFLF